ncbi:MAG: 4Fe-4S ferredoxin [Deltaproteobacteria bacterium]|jgi:formate hydrogenlyase subunit 6/NADH:ubiquinone oxidoreductase subunit I|nr:4Fe-4S ferredoxin [Deltaproteobacteria bacterium]
MFKMTPQVLQNLFSPKATRRYPRVARTPYEGVRGALRNDIENCSLCSVCALKCPSQCITVDKKTATWRYDPFACVFCGICVNACTEKCLHQERAYHHPVTRREPILLKGTLKKTPHEKA